MRVETQLVTVPAVVTDRTGRPLAGLRAENFVVLEDGKPQRVTNFATTEAPFEIALLLDTSGSTREELGLIRDAANAFINALRPGDRVGIVAFNNAPRNGSPMATVEVLSGLNSDRQALRAAIENLGTSNGTPFYDGLARVADQVFRDPPREEVRGRRAVVALTDGVDSSSDSGYDDARAKLARAGVASYFIQVNTEDYVEDRLLKDCQDDGRLTLSAKQLERFRQLFVPQAQKEDYQDFLPPGTIRTHGHQPATLQSGAEGNGRDGARLRRESFRRRQSARSAGRLCAGGERDRHAVQPGLLSFEQDSRRSLSSDQS